MAICRLGGPRITDARVLRPRPEPDLRPAEGDLPQRTLSTRERLPLHFKVANPAPGTKVDIWADDDSEGAGGTLIASDLPPSAAATWDLSRMGTGRFHPYAVIKRAGIPLETRYWPRAVDVVDAQAPASPPSVSVEPTRNGALASWGPSEGAQMYAVIARPVPASAGEPIEEAVSSAYSGLEIALPPGRRYEVSVQAIDPELRRSAESAPKTIAVRGTGDPPPVSRANPTSSPRSALPGRSPRWSPISTARRCASAS